MISRLARSLRRRLNNQHVRDEFVVAELKKLPQGALLLDAGCGSQRYRPHCAHLSYRAQDFGQYTVAERPMLGQKTEEETYPYGALDYVSDIWNIPEKDGTFDAILCTEVLEHLPYPIETIREFGRLLKPGGVLILTAPSNCLRHMDPIFFSSGFSDRWFERILPENNLQIRKIEPVGDYYSWMLVELARTAQAQSVVAKLLLAPAFLYYSFKQKSEASVNTLCMGYHVLASKTG
jgi:SAM-dependent methyltransferase